MLSSKTFFMVRGSVTGEVHSAIGVRPGESSVRVRFERSRGAQRMSSFPVRAGVRRHADGHRASYVAAALSLLSFGCERVASESSKADAAGTLPPSPAISAAPAVTDHGVRVLPFAWRPP